MTQRKPLSPTDIKFIEAKVEGKSDRQATKAAKPNISDISLGKVANRLSTNVNIQEAIAKAFERKGITLDKALEPINQALEYTDDDQKAEIDMRLKGSDRALRLMGADNRGSGGDTINNFIVIADQDKHVFGL